MEGYSRELKDLTQNMINVDPTARPEMKVLFCLYYCLINPDLITFPTPLFCYLALLDLVTHHWLVTS